MSTRDDAVLTEAEREAFARLQAQAAADDRSRRTRQLGNGSRAVAGVVASLAAKTWCAVAIIAVGVIAVVVGLASSIAVAVVGLVLIAGGGIPLVERLRRKVEAAVVAGGGTERS